MQISSQGGTQAADAVELLGVTFLDHVNQITPVVVSGTFKTLVVIRQGQSQRQLPRLITPDRGRMRGKTDHIQPLHPLFNNQQQPVAQPGQIFRVLEADQWIEAKQPALSVKGQYLNRARVGDRQQPVVIGIVGDAGQVIADAGNDLCLMLHPVIRKPEHAAPVADRRTAEAESGQLDQRVSPRKDCRHHTRGKQQ